jgi:hypothetical protein
MLAKVFPLALAVFVIAYATGIWRPDLSPLVWLFRELWGLLGLSG